MWLLLTLGSAFMLGLYDVAKKQAVRRNGVLYVLLCATALSTLFLCPFLKPGSARDHLLLIIKAVLVSVSWISGLVALKRLPITTASTIKASRPLFVVLLSVLLFGERLNLMQWGGVLVVLLSLYLLSRSSKREGIEFTHNRGVLAMWISVFSGVASALLDNHIKLSMEPLFIQSWCNLYTTLILALCVLCIRLSGMGGGPGKFQWDWTLVLIAVLITAADMCYFFALNQDGSMQSVITTLRRCSVIVTFAFGAWLFKEHNIKVKALELAIMLSGVALLIAGSLP